MQSTTHGSCTRGGSARFNADHLGERALLDGGRRAGEVGEEEGGKGGGRTEGEEEQVEKSRERIWA